MTSYPADWADQAIIAFGAKVNDYYRFAVRAWQMSTPLPVSSNNPLGMPATSAGASRWLGTDYGAFASTGDFYASLRRFALSSDGAGIAYQFKHWGMFEDIWAAVHKLPWPAVKTETDYPAYLLDACSAEFRETVSASRPEDRKTSGVIGTLASEVPSTGQSQAVLSKTLADALRVSRTIHLM